MRSKIREHLLRFSSKLHLLRMQAGAGCRALQWIKWVTLRWATVSLVPASRLLFAIPEGCRAIRWIRWKAKTALLKVRASSKAAIVGATTAPCQSIRLTIALSFIRTNIREHSDIIIGTRGSLPSNTRLAPA